MTQTTLWIIDTFLALFVVMLVRSREISWIQATLIGLFGFILAGTPFAYPVWWTLQTIIGAFVIG
ncbi:MULTISPECIES: hypothetical protein [Streptomyces]|uniref:Uncharacterized protein n=1 Tax=Streptomyces evansiae TaxID=3075535 RepID=A0ABU2R369_9ACTN|nr:MULTISPECIES: hypothetical protein [unclassified Streptomyces]EDY43602.1 hypothetical protein SSBG_01564 [Streptomyces sp. SPB074]MDT0409859.1 hypothetical protein [Streptomyces sp. DSM 41979]MYQ60081.1 hypothetical protein [Streptomyces sp. SID4926]WEH29085.1 hypothetical protein P0D76_18135 [Streptomyces sp. AM 3-1-1]SCD98248.1 hypothetical protein GA0115252_12625 [Streptomyces sp. DfronAA-171]